MSGKIDKIKKIGNYNQELDIKILRIKKFAEDSVGIVKMSGIHHSCI